MKRSKPFDFGQPLIYLAILIFAILCLLPMVLVVMISITDEHAIRVNGYSFLPEQYSLNAYQAIFSQTAVMIRSYSISLFITIGGTLSAVIITAMAAYALTNKAVKYRNHLALFFFFTMIFNGGIVPWYLVCQLLGLTNNIFALLIPNLLFNAFNLFLVRNFMKALPDALPESARIDGASDFVIAFRIIFPLCMPVLATIALLYGLAYWNDWWNAIMLVDNKNLYPIQYLLFKLQSDINMMSQIQGAMSSSVTPPTESVKMATAVVTIGPIVLMYPYLQRYLVKGLTIGAVKG